MNNCEFKENDIVVADNLIGEVISVKDDKITMVKWLNLLPHQITNCLVDYYTFRHATIEEINSIRQTIE
jgi:hypothetical protein